MSSCLNDSTNSLKRKPVDDATATGTTTKKIAKVPACTNTHGAFLALRSLQRTMSPDQATAEVVAVESRIAAAKREIRSSQKQIRELKKNLKAAEETLEAKKKDKKVLDDSLKVTQEMKRNDAERLIEMAGGRDGKGEDLSHDICLLFVHSQCTSDDFRRFVNTVAESGRGWFKLDALKGMVAMKDSHPMVAPFAKDLFHKISTSCSCPFDMSLILVELAKFLAVSGGDPISFVQALLAKAKEMEKAKPSGYHSMHTHTKCPILDLLKPVYEALGESCPCAKQALGAAMKLWLQKSIQEHMIAPATNYSVPELASNVPAGRGNDDLRGFLLSPTQSELRLNLSKNGRMTVHRLIDNQMNAYGKLTHESEGFGRDRILVIKKTAATADAMQKRRLQHHKELLAKLV